MCNTFVIMARAENILRVLQRVASLMTRKRLKIQDMQVRETGSVGISTLTLILKADVDYVHWLVKQMRKYIDIFELEFVLKK